MITNLNMILSNKIETIELLKQLTETDYSDMYNFYKKQVIPKIYRAHKNLGECFVLSPTYRKSIGTINVHTVLMSSILPSWKEYPKRSNCFIGLTDEDLCAGTYKRGEGNYNNENREVYVIFPKNNTNIAMCPRSDLWKSFHLLEPHFHTVGVNSFNNDFVNTLETFCYAFKIKIDKYNVISSNKINELFNLNRTALIGKLFSEIEKNIMISSHFNVPFIADNDEMVNFFYKKIKIGQSFIGLLELLFDPEINNFKLLNTKNLSSLSDCREVWFDSECLFVKLDSKLYQDLLYNTEKKN